MRGTWNNGLMLALLASVVIAQAGCAPFRLLANVMHASGVGLVPAEFEGLKGRKVAILCQSDSLSYGPSTASTQLAQAVGHILGQSVKELEVVPQREIENWLDQHDWNNFDLPALGEGVGADAVLAVDLHSFSLQDGQTLFKGRADLELVVYLAETDEKRKKEKDTAEQKSRKWYVAYRNEPPQIQFPNSAGITTTELSEAEFRRRFMAFLAQRIARAFFPYELKDEFAQDTVIVSR